MSDLTDHFSWAEVSRSAKAAALGIDNTIPPELRKNALRSAVLMEQIRAELGGIPLEVTSWYRCPKLNAAVGSGPRSVHPLALAVDFKPVGLSLEDAFHKIAGSLILFDQLIVERTQDGARWLHAALGRGQPRRQVMVAAGKVLGGQMVFTRIAEG